MNNMRENSTRNVYKQRTSITCYDCIIVALTLWAQIFQTDLHTICYYIIWENSFKIKAISLWWKLIAGIQYWYCEEKINFMLHLFGTLTLLFGTWTEQCLTTMGLTIFEIKSLSLFLLFL